MNTNKSTGAYLAILALLPVITSDLIPETPEMSFSAGIKLKPNFCLTNSDCSSTTGMVCYVHKCQCRENFFLNKDSNECLPRACTEDWHCFGLNGTECTDGHCICTSSYEYNERGECEPLPASCAFDFFCPGGSLCISGQCKCRLGTILSPIEQTCSQQRCTNNRDCVAWPNSICQNGRCACGFGYYLDQRLQRCYLNGQIPVETRSNFLMQNIFAIVVVCNFFLWISIFVLVMQYARRRRNLASAQRTALCNERLPRLPHGAPPPPPSYDYQNYRTQAQLAPPPYSIDDPAKPPEYSTVISTIPTSRGVPV